MGKPPACPVAANWGSAADAAKISARGDRIKTDGKRGGLPSATASPAAGMLLRGNVGDDATMAARRDRMKTAPCQPAQAPDFPLQTGERAGSFGRASTVLAPSMPVEAFRPPSCPTRVGSA